MSIKEIQVTIYPDGRLDAKNAAKYTELSEKSLAAYRCNGKGPRYVKKGKIFYFKDDLDAWLNEERK